ncbi:MAG: hypothetical protein J6G98_02180 [Bacilli bacterium]|nr:hypothetical protein [Bacilli bacterium]
MKKYLFYIVIAMSFLYAPSVLAGTNVKGKIVGSDILIGKNPNTTVSSCSLKKGQAGRENYAEPGVMHCLDTNNEVIILNYDSIIPSTINSCSKGYYYVNSISFPGDGNNHYGYVCADNVVVNVDVSKYADEFRNAGLPEIYWEQLSLLKTVHPNWKFKGYNTGLDWNDVINNESVVNYDETDDTAYGLNYVPYDEKLLSLEKGSYDPKTGTYRMFEAGGWYMANKQTIAHYMDPRNSFDDQLIFQFEKLSFDDTYQTIDVLNSILGSTPLKDYINYFYNAATYNNNNISPIMLAARSKQEVIENGHLKRQASGESGYYNFYNLGAFSSCENPVECAINFAKGYDGTYTSYNRPWTTAEAAILNGASYLAEGYIKKNQNTLYFQKFNVTGNEYGNYSHQYMTNLYAPSSESKSTYSSYKKTEGLIDSAFEFIIPVYNNMPATPVELPTSVDQTEKDNKNVEQAVEDIGKIISNAGYNFRGNYLVGAKINETAGNMVSRIGSGAEVIRDGVKMDSSLALGTADVLNVAGKSYRIIVYGDATGDGKVNAVDYVKIRNYIMGSSSLSGSFKEAADVNNDGTVSAVDYVNIRNYIMGNASVLK